MHFKMFSTISELYQLDGLDASLALSYTLAGGPLGGRGEWSQLPPAGNHCSSHQHCFQNAVVSIVLIVLMYRRYWKEKL